MRLKGFRRQVTLFCVEDVDFIYQKKLRKQMLIKCLLFHLHQNLVPELFFFLAWLHFTFIKLPFFVLLI